jgi:hypothetical protein
MEEGNNINNQASSGKEVIVVHHCTKEEKLGEMMGLMKRMTQQVYGNGQKGLAFTVPELSVKIEDLSQTIQLLRTNVSALMRFQAERTGDLRTEEKYRLSAIQWTGIIMASIVGFSGIIVALLKFVIK